LKIPTDLKVPSTIYKLYYEEFKNHSREPDIENGRQKKIYVPIDCKAVAKELDVDGDIVFGRLYYHLEEKHGYTRSDGSNVAFFSLMVGADRHCINFPLCGRRPITSIRQSTDLPLLVGMRFKSRAWSLRLRQAKISASPRWTATPSTFSNWVV
jgi:hypothetical protein